MNKKGNGKEDLKEVLFEKKQMGFYLHIPFCPNVCISCPYHKTPPVKEQVERYLRCLKKEISLYAAKSHIQAAEFIFGHIGGGTPSSLQEEQLEDLLMHLHKEFCFSKDAEITLETTPVDLTQAKAGLLLANGVNRISIGAQTFRDEELRHIGRNYKKQAVISCIRMLQEMGLKKINIDLMYGLPGQTMETWKETLKEAVGLGLNAISFYNYIYLDTPQAIIRSMRGKVPAMPDQKLRDEMFYYAAEYLTGQGYEGFYADAFVKPGYKAGYAEGPWERHLNTIGLGACSLGNVKRHWYMNEPDLDEYCRKVESGRFPYGIGSRITPHDELRRTMILGTKLCSVSRRDYFECYGVDFADLFQEEIQYLEDRGLAVLTDTALKVTGPKGWFYLDNIGKVFFEEEYKQYPQPLGANISRFMEE